MSIIVLDTSAIVLDFYFQGTNVYRLGLAEKFSEEETYRIMKEFAWKGIQVVREQSCLC